MNGAKRRKSERKRFPWGFRLALSLVVLITLALVGVIAWLVKTQDLDKLGTRLGILASIVTILIGLPTLFFTIVKWPDSESPKEQPPSFPSSGSIQAEEIRATNVANVQHIEQQIIYSAGKPGGQSVPLQLPRRAEHFVDREAERQRLLTEIQMGRVVTVCGLGGMGKTALVAEVLWTLAPADTPPAAFADGILFYSFYGQPSVTVSLEQFAYTLGEEPVPTPALAVQRAFSGRHLLLVLDGAEEADHLEQLLAVCGECAVLLSTRRRADAPDPSYRLDLQPLPEQEAVSVVQAFGGKQAADATATADICACVGNLPLALRLVGRYLAEQEEEASEYLSWLQHSPLVALDQGRSRQDSVRVLMARSVAQLSAMA